MINPPAMTLGDKRLRDQRIVARVQAMAVRNIPCVAAEFGIAQRQVYRIIKAAEPQGTGR